MDAEEIEVVVATPEEREMMGLPPADEAAGGKIEVVIGDEPAAKDPPAKAPPNPADEDIAALKRQKEEADSLALTERQKRQEAEQRAQALEGLAGREQANRVRADHQTVVAALDKVNADADAAEAAYAQALELGDFKAAAKQQRVLAQATSRAEKLTELKGNIEAAMQRGRQVAPEGRVQAPQRPAAPALPADPVDRALATGGYTPQSATWLRQHPQCLTDPKLHSRMIGAHHEAIGLDLTPDTPDYFAHLESRLFNNGAGRVADAGAEATREPARAAPRMAIAAPPSRQAAPTVNGRGQMVVRLTAAEAEFCRETGEDINEYAANKAALMREGKLTA